MILANVPDCSEAVLKSIDNFNYVTSMVITPMFLVAGTFFPLSRLPRPSRTTRFACT